MVESEINNSPMVSIIVPCYNHEKYIEECILSVVNQTCKNIELIVIDDGSTDGSPEILQRLQKQYGFILEFQSNMGLSKTMNKAINKYAHGKYIAGSASDDYLALDRIEKQVNYMESHPECAMSFGNVYMVDEESKIIDGLVIIGPVIDPVKNTTFESLIDYNCIPSSTVMLKKEVFDECGGYRENIVVEDFDLWLKIAYKHRIDYIDDSFTYYRWHGDNMTTYTLKMCNAVWDVVWSWKDKIDPALANRVLARRSSASFNVLARQHKKESLRYLKLNYSYWDSYMLKNYVKGFIKLFFFWGRINKSVWK